MFEDHKDGISSSRVAERERIGSATVERWYHDLLGKKVSELSGAACPVELGMDEHFFTRRRGYATTLCDLPPWTRSMLRYQYGIGEPLPFSGHISA